MPQFSLQVKREILVDILIEADSPEEAIRKYEEGEYEDDQAEITDCSDVTSPDVLSLKSESA